MLNRTSTSSVASQITQPASIGTIAHQMLRTADSVTTPIRIMPMAARRRPSISIAAKPSASSTGGPTTAGRAIPCRAANASAASRSAETVAITLCSCVFFSRATTAVVVPLASISVPRNRGCFVSRSRSAALRRRVAPGGPDRPADGHRVGLQVDIGDGPPGRAQGHVAGHRRQAVQREQGVVDRPEQRHRIQRLDPLHALDPPRRERRGQLRDPIDPRRASAARGRHTPRRRSCRRRTCAAACW